MGLEGALDTFYAESSELLEAMEQALLRMDDGEYDADILNEIFRSAHTIKGSAGIFGLDHIVAFTHVVENVLDRARDDEIKIESELLNIIFQCRDHIAALVEVDTAAFDADDELQVRGQELLKKLEPWARIDDSEQAESGDEAVSSAEGGGASGVWHISLRLSPDCLKNGMDPMSFIHFLTTLGDIHHIETMTDNFPDIDSFDPETLYLAYEIGLDTAAGREEIEDAFSFVQEDSQIIILPPKSKVEEYVELIEKLPEENQRLGEILIRCGALSPERLERALSQQAQESMESGISRKIGQVLTDNQDVPEKVVEAAVAKQSKGADKKGGGSPQLIRIEAERLDHLINLIGELVISRQRVDTLAETTGNDPLIEAVTDLGGFTEQLRDAALNLRMVPIGSTFQRFKRIVRDTAQELGKEINLVLEGAETELDRLMVEKLTDPLTHIVRNAIDHGIESVENRREAGKSEAGTLKMSAFHDAGNIVIEVCDDGGGIVAEKIRAKAVDKGIIDADAELPVHEILQLVFHPGFSTAESVTNLSGRGVGMDVVKRNVEALQGLIDIHSEVGVGTTFRIRLPLTLAIIDGFHVASGGTHFILPQAAVVECTDLQSHLDVGTRDCINLRGEMIPFLRLGDTFKLSNFSDSSRSIATDTGMNLGHTDNLLVVQIGEEQAGIVVDELFGEIQTVVKPLGPIFKPLKGIGGSTLLGNGDIAFILDIPQLISAVVSGELSDA